MRRGRRASFSARSSFRRPRGSADRAEERAQRIASSVVAGHYERAIDRESAYEKLKGRRTELRQAEAPARTGDTGAPARTGGTSAPAGAPQAQGAGGMLSDILLGSTGPRGGRREGVVEAAAKSMARQVGREIMRGVLGSILGGRRR